MGSCGCSAGDDRNIDCGRLFAPSGDIDWGEVFSAPAKRENEGEIPQREIYDLRISFNIITGFVYEFQTGDGKRVRAYNLLKCADITTSILPEVNRIWGPAGIHFHVKQCRQVPALPRRLGPVDIFDHVDLDDPKALNVYFIPFMAPGLVGSHAGGYGSFNGWVTVGEWQGAPRPHNLVGISLAHELGHSLGLGHTSVQTRLMSGAGEQLSQEEITTTRKFAAKFAAKFASRI